MMKRSIPSVMVTVLVALSAAYSLPSKRLSEFKDVKPVFSTAVVPPGSWIVVIANSAEDPKTNRVIQSQNYCGLKPGFFVTYESWNFDKNEAKKHLDRLTKEKKSAYLRNVGAWSNTKPCKDSSNTSSWHFQWVGGEVWGEIGSKNSLYINQKNNSNLFEGHSPGKIELFPSTQPILYLHLEDQSEPSDEPAQSENMILAIDNQGKEIQRWTYSVGDDYSDESIEIKQGNDGDLYLLKGNPTNNRSAFHYNPSSGAFENKFEVSP